MAYREKQIPLAAEDCAVLEIKPPSGILPGGRQGRYKQRGRGENEAGSTDGRLRDHLYFSSFFNILDSRHYDKSEFW